MSFKSGRRAPGKIIEVEKDTELYVIDPDWNYYEYARPQQDLPIIIRCPDRLPYERVVVPRDLPPEFNIFGLQWKPTGIFLEFSGEITYTAYQQQNSQYGSMGGFLPGLLGSAGSSGVATGLAANFNNWNGDYK